MPKKFRLDNKTDMKKFQEEIKSQAKKNVSEQKFEVNCPHCDTKIHVPSGKSTCPNCDNEIDLNLNFV